MAGEQGLVPGLGYVEEIDSYQNLVPGAGYLEETVAAAATVFIPIVGRGPGMSLAENGGGLAGVAQ